MLLYYDVTRIKISGVERASNNNLMNVAEIMNVWTLSHSYFLKFGDRLTISIVGTAASWSPHIRKYFCIL